MAKTEVGRLAVILDADATSFEKALAKAEKRMAEFVGNVTSPLSTASRIGERLLGSITGPVAVATGAVQGLTTLIDKVGDAIDPIGARLFNPEQFKAAMDGVVERIGQVAREAKKLDFEPKFVAAMRMAAPYDADAMIAAAKKFEAVLGEATFGGGKELKNGLGNKSFFEKLDLDPKALARMGPEQAFVTTIERFAGLKDKLAESGIAMQGFGKGGKEAAEGLKSLAEHLPQMLARVGASGLYSPEKIGLVEKVEQHHRDIEFRKKVHDANEFEAWGAAKEDAEETMKNTSVFDFEYWEAKNRKNRAEAVGRARRFGSTEVLDEIYQPHWLRTAHNQEPGKAGQPKLSAAELADKHARDAATGASQEHISVLERETAAILGRSTAVERAAVVANNLLSAEQKAKELAAIDAHEVARPTKQAEEMLRTLTEQNDAWGKSVDYAKAYKMVLDGVNPSTVAKITEQLEKQERNKLFDETRSPAERAQNEIARIMGLLNKDTIGRDLAGRGIEKALKDAGVTEGPYKLAPTYLRGSAEDVSALNKEVAERKQTDGRKDQQLAELRNIVAAQNSHKAVTEDLLKAVESNPMPVFPEGN